MIAASRTVVVAAASRHGETAQVADRVGRILHRVLPAHWHVRRIELSDFRELDGADAVVLGSAVYYGHWMHSAARALEHVCDETSLSAGLWLFSAGPVSPSESDSAQIVSADALVDAGRAQDHQVFGWVQERDRAPVAQRVAVRAMHLLLGEHRDWSDVDDWARRIGAELTRFSPRGRPEPQPAGRSFAPAHPRR